MCQHACSQPASGQPARREESAPCMDGCLYGVQVLSGHCPTLHSALPSTFPSPPPSSRPTFSLSLLESIPLPPAHTTRHRRLVNTPLVRFFPTRSPVYPATPVSISHQGSARLQLSPPHPPYSPHSHTCLPSTHSLSTPQPVSSHSEPFVGRSARVASRHPAE